MKINNLRIKDVVKNCEIREQEFEYAGMEGIAELLGWQIISFRKNNQLDNTVVVSFSEIESPELVNIANTILKTIGMNIKFGDSIDIINKIYGIPEFTDDLYEDMIRYNYIISPKLFLAFGIKNGVLSSLEIVSDESIVKEIISIRREC